MWLQRVVPIGVVKNTGYAKKHVLLLFIVALSSPWPVCHTPCSSAYYDPVVMKFSFIFPPLLGYMNQCPLDQRAREPARWSSRRFRRLVLRGQPRPPGGPDTPRAPLGRRAGRRVRALRRLPGVPGVPGRAGRDGGGGAVRAGRAVVRRHRHGAVPEGEPGADDAAYYRVLGGRGGGLAGGDVFFFSSCFSSTLFLVGICVTDGWICHR